MIPNNGLPFVIQIGLAQLAVLEMGNHHKQIDIFIRLVGFLGGTRRAKGEAEQTQGRHRNLRPVLKADRFKAHQHHQLQTAHARYAKKVTKNFLPR